MDTIFYRLGDALYINITNQCPCACIFCIRNTTDTVGDAPTLWLKNEPTLEEIFAAFDARDDLQAVTEIVFCGYGEPLTRAEDVIKITQYIQSVCNIPIRINTNGLVKLIHPSFDTTQLAMVDSLSISLNAHTPEEYLRLVRPKYGIDSYASLLAFIKEAKNHTAITLSIMEDLSPEGITACRKIAEDLGLPLRIRAYY